jgi:hypothetical protein
MSKIEYSFLRHINSHIELYFCDTTNLRIRNISPVRLQRIHVAMPRLFRKLLTCVSCGLCYASPGVGVPVFILPVFWLSRSVLHCLWCVSWISFSQHCACGGLCSTVWGVGVQVKFLLTLCLCVQPLAPSVCIQCWVREAVHAIAFMLTHV